MREALICELSPVTVRHAPRGHPPRPVGL